MDTESEDEVERYDKESGFSTRWSTEDEEDICTIDGKSNPKMANYYTSGFEDVQNWPFSVRYTASPYRKSKFPVAPPESGNGNAATAVTSATVNNTNNNHHHLHHNGSSASSTNSNSSNNSIDCRTNVHASAALRPHQILLQRQLLQQQQQQSQQFQLHALGHLSQQQQQQEAAIWNSSHPHQIPHSSSSSDSYHPQQIHAGEPSTAIPYHLQETGIGQHEAFYQQQYCSLSQAANYQQQQHQSYLQSFVPADHHHYGLPASQFQDSNNALFLRQRQNHLQVNGEEKYMLRNEDSTASSGLSNPFSVDGIILDEGYIEDLKPPYGLPPGNIVLINNNSSGGSASLNGGYFNSASDSNSGIISHHYPSHLAYPQTNSCDYNPYSYVYDSQIISANHKPQLLQQQHQQIENSTANKIGTNSIIERLQREALALQAAAAAASVNGSGTMTQVNNNKHQMIVNTSPSLSMKHSSIIGKGLTRANSLSKSSQGSRRSSFENEYEEISDVVRYMTMTSPPNMTPGGLNIGNVNATSSNNVSDNDNGILLSEHFKSSSVPSCNNNNDSLPRQPLHFKSFSSTDDILAEVVQVQERHDRVLDQLNLEVENLLIRSSSEIIVEASNEADALTSARNDIESPCKSRTAAVNHRKGTSDSGLRPSNSMDEHCYCNLTSAPGTSNGKHGPVNGDINVNHVSCLNGAGDYCCQQSIIERGSSSCQCIGHEKGKAICGGLNSSVPCSNNYCSCCSTDLNNDITSGGSGGGSFYNNGPPVPNNNMTFSQNTNSLLSNSRKKKLDRIFGVTHSQSTETISSSSKDKNASKLHQSHTFLCNNKNGNTCACNSKKAGIVKSNSTTSSSIVPAAAAVSHPKHHRSYSLIPHWKIRDHLMRLPFLRQHNNDKLKKSASETNSLSRSLQSSKKFKQTEEQQQQPAPSSAFTSIVPPEVQQAPPQLSSFHRDFSAGRGNKLLRRNINSYIAPSSNAVPLHGNLPHGSRSFIMASSVKARSSSMDELRPTPASAATATEEHWYSADSDTDPDSLTLLQQQQKIQQEQQHGDNSNANGTHSTLGNNNSNNNANSIMALNNNNLNTRRNSADTNGQSRCDISAIPDAPKAPKFRRGPTSTASGFKEKFRESWQSKTLSRNNVDEENPILRWFSSSLRKNQGANNNSHQNNNTNGCSNSSQDQSATLNNNHRNSVSSGASSTLQVLNEEDMKRISFLEDEEGYWPRRTVQPPSLPPPPLDLTPQQLTRRHIVAAIVHTENNYVATLQRLVNEYKKCLEASHPPILGPSKIPIIFHRLPEILQCHSLFRIALAEYIRKWDKDEAIGDVFVASFSKSLVLDVYSEFINNFSNAMETAKSEARRKSVFAEFLKIKQITAHDRLSLFGLMVKPVQRFPQFILLLQDLLKNTPKDHHDRMSLQLALTQLESLAAMLNERKRESEQYQAFRETIKSISGGKFVLLRSVVDDPNRILLRQDVVTQLEFDSNGGSVAKSKCRKLLLLNDLLICVSLNQSCNSQHGSNERNPSSSSSSGLNNKHNNDNNSSSTQQTSWGSSSSGKGEKSVFKWSYRVQEVEVDDISISPTMSRLVPNSHPSASSAGSGSKLARSTSFIPPTAIENETQLSKSLLEEMQSLMYDYEVLSRVLGLVATLKSTYDGLNETIVKEMMLEIQHQIRCRDEQISYFDSSCLTLLLGNPNGNNREKVVFQMASPAVRNEWIEELRLAQLALDPNNSPGWDIPTESPYPSHKLPLFVRALPLCRSPNLTTVKCGCFFTHTFVSPTGRSKILDYLWASSTDGISSHVTAFRSQQNTLKEVSSFDLMEERINDLLFVSGYVWVATENQKILIFDPADPDLNKGSINQLVLSSSVVKLALFDNAVYAGLADGHLAIFTRIHNPKGTIEPDIVLEVGTERVTSVFGSRDHIYAACGNAVVIIDAKTHIIERNAVLTHHNGPISHMTCSGVGLWIAAGDSGTICLYHLESLQHLQDVSIAPSVFRTVRDSYRRQKGCHVTCLTAHKGWLWIGTNLGVVLTIPLPRLEGVPIISTGKANVSYHGFYGPVTFLMPLVKQALPPQKVTTTKPQKAVQIAPNEVISIKEAAQQEQLDKLEKPSETVQETEQVKQSDVEDALTRRTSSKGSNLDVSPQTSMSSGLSGSHDGSGNETLLAGGTTPQRSTSLSPSSSINNPNKSFVVLRKKNSRDSVFTSRNCKTLPRPGAQMPSNLRFSIDSDVYGLYGNLINVRGLEEEGRFFDPLYDALRRSDPELIALDSKISTLDRRLKMRMSRPRSLDLSNWSVDSKISVSSDESGGGGASSHLSGGSSTQAIENLPTSPPSTTTVTGQVSDSAITSTTATETNTTDSSTTPTASPSTNTSKKTVGRKGNGKGSNLKTRQDRTIMVVVGGRGYINMKTQTTQDHYLQQATANQSESGDIKHCTHLTIWQMKT